jgi:phosphatidylethanolamine N-methyltransferase
MLRVYNFSLTMTYVTFIIAALKLYSPPENWTSDLFGGVFLLRHIFGMALIALHIWMATSVLDVLGDFGWFYGDFFIDEFPAELQYTGIYRYLNNPEKILGHAAFWGVALMSFNGTILAVTLFSHICNWWFLEHVET